MSLTTGAKKTFTIATGSMVLIILKSSVMISFQNLKMDKSFCNAMVLKVFRKISHTVISTLLGQLRKQILSTQIRLLPRRSLIVTMRSDSKTKRSAISRKSTMTGPKKNLRRATRKSLWKLTSTYVMTILQILIRDTNATMILDSESRRIKSTVRRNIKLILRKCMSALIRQLI